MSSFGASRGRLCVSSFSTLHLFKDRVTPHSNQRSRLQGGVPGCPRLVNDTLEADRTFGHRSLGDEWAEVWTRTLSDLLHRYGLFRHRELTLNPFSTKVQESYCGGSTRGSTKGCHGCRTSQGLVCRRRLNSVGSGDVCPRSLFHRIVLQ